MFDFGFWELTIVMVIALLVVGPERLPALAGQIGKWVGKAKRMIDGVRADIESEIKAAELKEILEKQQNEIGELKEMLKDTQSDIEKSFDEEGDRELIEAVEKHIEANKKTSELDTQQELSLNTEAKSSQKNEVD